MNTGKVAGIGLAAGSVWGALVSMLYDGPQVGSNVKYPQLIRTGKVCGHYAASFAVIGATYEGVEQALEKYRMKKDIFNGGAAGFATGAVMGFRGKTFILLQLLCLAWSSSKNTLHLCCGICVNFRWELPDSFLVRVCNRFDFCTAGCHWNENY
ncbi:hypothetical protein BAE44_0013604 [Dichanthelium oligosanthes]|uniref:Outer envelope pore protein 16-3, chloroplastic/mitochondrial n=1 Tax=Dichanthelium oligosanthes TaxID=888268 RepID=A0A1E5VJU9_9POAL|nr:hypothetical protein BAE44_0013604 [Dichanthelium oligosanthes]